MTPVQRHLMIHAAYRAASFDHTTPPTPDVLIRVRELKGLSQEQAAQLLQLGGRSRWSEYERGKHIMPRTSWELLLVKLDLHPEYTRRPT